MTDHIQLAQSWQSAIDKFIAFAANEKHYSNTTIDAYTRNLNASAMYFSQFAKQWQDIEPENVKGLLAKLKSRNLSLSLIHI